MAQTVVERLPEGYYVPDMQVDGRGLTAYACSEDLAPEGNQDTYHLAGRTRSRIIWSIRKPAGTPSGTIESFSRSWSPRPRLHYQKRDLTGDEATKRRRDKTTKRRRRVEYMHGTTRYVQDKEERAPVTRVFQCIASMP